MPYTAETPPRVHESSEELRARIPGWGVDADPNDRPSFPRERFDPGGTGAHWEFPERQEQHWPRERSVEHAFVTPVFGTSCPPKGLSGAMRKLSYARYSEARAAHWLLLLAADRVDAAESHLRSFLSRRPDDPVTQSGILSERRRHGIRSRYGVGRADSAHQLLDPFIVFGPWVAVGWVVTRRVVRGRRRR